MSDEPDYTKMDGPTMLYALNDDGYKWATAFLQHNPNANVTHETLVGWFANIIEHSYDYRTGRVHNGDHMQWLIDNEVKP